MRINCDKGNPPLGGILAAEFYKSLQKPVDIIWGSESTIVLTNGSSPIPYEGSNDLIRILERSFNIGNPAQNLVMNHWLTFCLNLESDMSNAVNYLNVVLGPSTYLIDSSLSVADLAVFAIFHASTKFNEISKANTATNVLRWMKLIHAQPSVAATLKSLPADVLANLNKMSNLRASPEIKKEGPGGRQQEGKFIELPHAEMGKVVVRFPPEASGYLHIGHAKAALLNQYYQQAFDGKLIMRFDDTNPAKENAEFEKVILGDVELLEIKPDMFTHTSQYFDLMLQYCEKLIKEGKAFVDDTPAEEMKNERDQKVDSKNRNNSVEKNLKLWEEMKKGSDIGIKCCVRAKIDMQSTNGCLRDPTIYRCKPEPHPRTGTQYKVYPTYDFACPIVDSIEGVTHVLRTMEYHDRDPQFYWFIEALGIRKPYIWEYSRLSMTNTVLSKRKLTWFVEQGLVDGWDDPRMPTVRGVLRRGMTVEGLRQFIQAQGSSRSVVFMEWDKIWAINKKVIDPIAPRYTALESYPVPVNLKNITSDNTINVALHPKNPEIGNKTVWISKRLLIDQADAKTLKEGENTTFINYGNVMIDKIHRAQDGSVTSIDGTPNLENKDYKKTLKITWLADTPQSSMVETYCVYFDHIISKPLLGKDEDFKQFIGHQTRWEIPMLGEIELSKVKVGDIIQLQRRGFFRVDVTSAPPSPLSGKARPLILFHVPDGHTKEMPGQPKPSVTANSKQPTAANNATQIKKSTSPIASSSVDLDKAITAQGDLVRSLKSSNADKGKINEVVKVLLELKAKYKEATGKDWNSGAAPTKAPARTETAKVPNTKMNGSAEELNLKIVDQGNKVRTLKEQKADKATVQAEVKTLLNLKAEYKAITGSDWSPNAKTPAPKQETKVNGNAEELNLKIVDQGNKVRTLKEQKADKATVQAEVKTLLSLKAEYKAITGSDWSPNVNPPASLQVEKTDGNMGELNQKIVDQGNKVRSLKEQKADKAAVQAEVQTLLELKATYKKSTGNDWGPTATVTQSKPREKKEAKPKEVKPKENKSKEQSPKPSKEESTSGVKKITRLGLEASKDKDLPEWYSQVITKSEMIEYYDISGCYILRPWSYGIWDHIRDFLSSEFKKIGVKDCYFPIFVSKAALEREQTHIADFAPEVAWVTHSGSSELAEHIAVRPTSETVMYPAYAKWIQSHRDLPLKLNQWNNVVRWEFKQPQPFIRTREFLWQEGHTAFLTREEADKEVLHILDLYASVYEDLLAIPVIKGRKTEKEKFAGGDYTTTVEAYVPASGRGIQGATSHHLGQNFSKMFEIIYDDPETQEKKYVFQNSWGLTTRTIGVMILVHGDDRGLVLPPRVAAVQVIVVPCGITANSTAEDRENLKKSCEELVKKLVDAGVRAEGDYRDNYSPGWKFNHWELKGVPIRVELGPKDIAKSEIVAVRRLTGEKVSLKRDSSVKDITDLLETTHQQMFARATEERDSRLSNVTEWDQFTMSLEKKHILLAPFCGETPCEDNIKNDSARVDEDDTTDVKAPAMGAKSLCIPFKQPRDLKPTDRCIHPACKNKPKFITLFGRSY